MTAEALLVTLRARGVLLVAAGDRLRYRPAGRVSAGERAALSEHKAELLALLRAEADPVAWREAAMRTQLEGVAAGDKVPALHARRGPHVPVRGCERACRPDGRLCSDCGRACPSCGEPSRLPGGRCDSCFAAALRVVPTDVLLSRERRR
jgi:hypothetical protein